jgi:hypothetical protein
VLDKKTNIYTKDLELIEVTEHILNWLKHCNPPVGANKVLLVGRRFTEVSYNVMTSESYQCTEEINTSQQSLATFFVANNGSNDAVVKLQISPNNTIYMDDGIEVIVKSGQLKALVPMIFAKYTHLCYKSLNENSTSLEIIIQGCI